MTCSIFTAPGVGNGSLPSLITLSRDRRRLLSHALCQANGAGPKNQQHDRQAQTQVDRHVLIHLHPREYGLGPASDLVRQKSL